MLEFVLEFRHALVASFYTIKFNLKARKILSAVYNNDPFTKSRTFSY